MAYLNKVMLIGNVGKDPVLGGGQNGSRKRVSFSLATSRRYRDNNGEQKEDTQWHNVVGWGKTADIFEQLGIRKGASLYVEGTLTNRSWTDQNGQKRYSTEVSLDTFQVLTPKSQQGNGGTSGTNPYSHGNSGSSGQQDAGQQNNPFEQGEEGDDGLPF